MIETRFMQVMFSATEAEDIEKLDQTKNEIDEAKSLNPGEMKSTEDNELTYVNLGSGKILVVDNENGESTVIEGDSNDPESFELTGFETPDEALNMYLHPLEDGVTPDEKVQTEETENVEEDHLGGEEISNATPDVTVEENAEGVCPECGKEPCECEKEEDEEEEEQHEFSNTAVAKLFSNPEFYCNLFSEVISEEKPAFIGDLKIEISEEDPETIIVTDGQSGDAAQVDMGSEDGPVVSELQKECSEEEQYLPLFVVGIFPDTAELIDSQVYTEDEANELAQKYTEMGAQGVQVFEDQLGAQEYAVSLIEEVGANPEMSEEPEEHTFSDVTIYTTRFYSKNDTTAFMERLYSEANEEISDSQDAIEEAIESGEQVEDDGLVITPISDDAAVVADKENGEYTKVVLEEGDLDVNKIDEEEAAKLTDHVEVGEEKAYSKYELTLSMYSDARDEVAEVIKSGEELDTDDKTITPVSEDTAIVFDKDADEFTKVVVDGEGNLETDAITKEEAQEEVEKKEEENQEKEGEEEAKEDEKEAEAEVEEEKKENENKEEDENKTFSTLDKFFADVVVNPETGDPVEAPVEKEGAEENKDSVEAIEDKAFEAVQSIQAAAEEAVSAIQEAKEAPAPGEEEDLKEAHFSENNAEQPVGTLNNWLKSI